MAKEGIFKITYVFFAAILACFICLWFMCPSTDVFAFPFYDLQPNEITLRARFYTSYPASTEARKENIALAAKSLDNVIVDVGGEFSFNRTVGERTTDRGYKQAKIIVNGEFVDGVGGGVCQVSTTLYNAVLLAGLNITEYHAHSLPVSYIAPSFDAMVNSGWADLRFVNDTHNPVIIKTVADGAILEIKIYGEPMEEKYSRKSLLIEEIHAPNDEIFYDEEGKYPDLFEGESRVLRYGKSGYKSEGYIIITKNGKLVDMRKIRSDKYNAVGGVIVRGKAIRLPETEAENPDLIKNDFVAGM